MACRPTRTRGHSSEPHLDAFLPLNFCIPRNELAGLSHIVRQIGQFPITVRQAGVVLPVEMHNALLSLGPVLCMMLPQGVLAWCTISSAARSILGNENIGWYSRGSPVGVFIFRYSDLLDIALAENGVCSCQPLAIVDSHLLNSVLIFSHYVFSPSIPSSCCVLCGPRKTGCWVDKLYPSNRQST